jgi:hypothetical protein
MTNDHVPVVWHSADINNDIIAGCRAQKSKIIRRDAFNFYCTNKTAVNCEATVNIKTRNPSIS